MGPRVSFQAFLYALRLEVGYQDYVRGKMPVMGTPLHLFVARWNGTPLASRTPHGFQ